MNEQAIHPSAPLDQTELQSTVVLALLVSVAFAAVLAALVFWPNSAWVPPQRPGLTAPIVFDEFVNLPAATSATSATPGAGVN
jgi:hypothetical protein